MRKRRELDGVGGRMGVGGEAPHCSFIQPGIEIQ